jgi:hypothetical protein
MSGRRMSIQRGERNPVSASICVRSTDHSLLGSRGMRAHARQDNPITRAIDLKSRGIGQAAIKVGIPVDCRAGTSP